MCPIFHESSPSHSSLAERPLPPRSSLPTSGAAVASTRGSPSPSPGFPSRSGSLVFVAAFRGFLYHWARACVQIALSPRPKAPQTPSLTYLLPCGPKAKRPRRRSKIDRRQHLGGSYAGWHVSVITQSPRPPPSICDDMRWHRGTSN